MAKSGAYNQITDPADNDQLFITDESATETHYIEVADLRSDQDSLSALTNVATDDEVPIYDTSDSNTRKKITVSDLFDQHGDLTGVTDVDPNDEIEFYDDSDSDNRKKATRTDLLDDNENLTANSVLADADDFRVYDSSNSEYRKMTFDDVVRNVRDVTDIDITTLEVNKQDKGGIYMVGIYNDADVPDAPSGTKYLFFDSSNGDALSTKDSSGTVTTV